MALQEIGRLAESRFDGEEIKIFTTEVTEDTGETGISVTSVVRIFYRM